MPAAGHDGCHPQEVLSLTLLGGLCEIQLHGEALGQGASWDWGAEPGDLSVLCWGKKRLGLVLPVHPKPPSKVVGLCPSHLGWQFHVSNPSRAPALSRRSPIHFTDWRGGLTRVGQALDELAGLLGFPAASLGDFGHVAPFLPALKKPQTPQSLAEGS